ELVAQELLPEPRFELEELRFNRLRLVLVAHDIFAVALQEVPDRLHPDPDRPGGLVLVDVLEAEVWRAGVLHDLFHYGVDRSVVAALETRQLEGHQVWMPRDVLRGPHLPTRVFAVRILPHVRDGHGVRNLAGRDLSA